MWPIIKLKQKFGRMRHPIQKTEIIITRRNMYHELYIIAERAGNKIEAEKNIYKRDALNWVLKENKDG